MKFASEFLGDTRAQRQVRELRERLEIVELRAQQDAAELRSEAEKAEHRLQEAQRGPGWRLAAVGVSLLALLGVGGTVAGAWIGAHTASVSSSQQQKEERDREAREKRAQVYADYLATTSAYQAELANLEFRSLSQPAIATTNADFQRLVMLNRSFSSKADLVAVYGSDDAWSAHLAIRSALPEAIAGAPGKVVITGHAESDTYDVKKYFSGYTQFQAVFCREASARPRTGCR
jgi:hypothetical protein